LENISIYSKSLALVVELDFYAYQGVKGMLSSLISLRAIKFITCLSIAISGLVNAAQGYLIAEKESWIQEKDVNLPLNIPEKDIANGTYFLSLDKQLRVDEKTRKNYTSVAKYVANRSGVDRNSQINIYYDPIYETIKLHSINVKRGGLILAQLSSAKINELRTEPELSNLIYNGRTQINIILNDIRVGDLIEYQYTREGANPVYEGNFSYSRYQQWDVTFFNQSFRLLWLKEKELNVDESLAYAKLKKSSISGGTLYEYEVVANTAIELDEDTPESIDPYDRVYFTEAESWKDVSEWSLPLYEKSISQDNAILDIANHIKKNNPTKSEQVSAALAYVQDKIRYFGIELGKNSHQPSNALTTLERRYGDCKDKAVLFISILKALDIKAFPALVNTEKTYLLGDMPPMYTAFDHVIVKVNLNNKVYWLDPTRIYQYGKLDDLYQPEYKFALVVDKNTEQLTEMQVNSNSSVKVIEEFDFIDERKVNYTVTSIYKGNEAERFYDTLLSDGLNSLQDSYFDYYQSIYPNIEIISSLKVTDYENSGVLEALESYQFEVDVNQFDFAMSFDAYNLASFLEEPNDIDRTFSYDQYSHTHREHEVIIKLPEDKFDIKNYSYKKTNNYFDYSLATDFDEENDKFRLSYRFIENSRIVDIKNFDAYLIDLDESMNNTSYTLSNEKHKKVLSNSYLGFTLNNFLTYLLLSFFVLLVIFFIALVFNYFRKRNKGFYNFENQIYYPISMKKFILMNVFTLGLFHIFWSYKNWCYIEKKHEKSFWTYPRSFFYSLTFYSLNSWVNKDEISDDGSPNIYSRDVAILIFIFLVFIAFYNVFNNSDYDAFVIPFIILFYAPFVKFFSKLNDKENIDFESNSKISILHYMFFVSAAPFLIYMIISPFNLLHDRDVIFGDDVYEVQIEYFKSEGLIGDEEEIKMLSSSAMFDIRDNGSGFTNKAVFRYWQEDEGGFYFYSKPISEISKIDTKTEEEYTVLEISFSDSDYLDLYILNSESMDSVFIKALREKWNIARL